MSAAAISPALPVTVAGASAPASRYAPLNAYLSRVAPHHFISLEKYRSEDPAVNPLAKYSNSELVSFMADFEEAAVKTFERATKDRSFLVTAGGPAAGKSTLLESRLDESFAYVDPDRTGLQKYMTRTHLADRSRSAAEGYDHWRTASLCLSDILLAIGLSEGYKLAFGSTMTSPHIGKMLESVTKNYHYTVAMLHVTSPDAVRVATEGARRSGGTVQCTDADLENKGRQFYDRLPDFLAHADEIKFYYRATPTGEAVKAASISRGPRNLNFGLKDGSAWEQIIAEHDAHKGPGAFRAVLTDLLASTLRLHSGT